MDILLTFYLLSRRAKKIAPDVFELQTKGKDYVDFSYPTPPVGIEALPSKSDEEFESRKLKEEEVMVALRDESVTITGICGKTTLVEKTRQRVEQERFFDEALDLKKLGIPIGGNHSHRRKVTLTACLQDVCEIMEAQRIMEVGSLSEKEAWILFRQKAGNSIDDHSLQHTEKECKDFPLAIITVV
ncbi:hypothetical protein RND71_015904 [Anisodus tanguticus]|uniref:NB-ARC domain-containing protein n=1 Tax=Anisodus tanguticus TaxID=243964 RepID=A0AAE1S757_9SOLA|nr:hypothetical protein RND71_015904 [Anisodus tanguticus]